jgi:hypothetical protein
MVRPPLDATEEYVGKKSIWIGMFVGSSIGGFLPMLWHAGMLSMWGIVMSTIGGIAGIWIAYRIDRGY